MRQVPALGEYLNRLLPLTITTSNSCPTECRLSRSDGKWKCVVSLRRLTDETGQVLGQVRNETFGPIITNKKEVEERIRRAQRAILNPNKPTKHFLEGEDEDPAEPELSFSTNCVSLQISGPDVADLSFCDLPGSYMRLIYIPLILRLIAMSQV